MIEEKKSNTTQPQEATNPSVDEQEIDLMDILRKIISIRNTLYKAAEVGLIIGIIVALSIPKKYTVNVTLSPEIGYSKGNNGLMGLAASFLDSGVSMGENIDALNASLSADIISSTPFLLELLDMEVVISDKGQVVSLNNYLEAQSSPWWIYIMGFPSWVISEVKSLFEDEKLPIDRLGQRTIELTKEEDENIEFLKKSIITTIDKKTAITSVSVTLQDPKVTASVADSIIYKLQEYIVSYRTSKSKEDCAYLEKLCKERQQEYYTAQKKYADYVDTHDNLILQSVRAEQERLQNDMSLAYQIYSQVANQLQVSRAKVQEVKPVFAVVEPAVVPLLPSGMGAKMYVAVFVLVVILGTIGWTLFGKNLLRNLKDSLK